MRSTLRLELLLPMVVGLCFGGITSAEELPPLTQLSAGANLLRMVNDRVAGSDLLAKKCGLSAEDAKNRLLALHPLVDSKVRRVAKQFEDSWLVGWSEECSKYCRCGSYVSVIEKLAAERVTRLPPDSLSALRGNATKQTEKDTLRCAKEQVWICQEPWFRALALEAREFEKVDGY